jgi:hypothetical protein
MDFFSDMVVNVVLAATQASQGVVPAFPAYISDVDQEGGAAPIGGTPSNLFQESGKVNFPSAGTYSKYKYEYVNAAGVVQAVGAAAQNFVRYAEYPGQRLFRKVKFSVNNNPLNSFVSTFLLCYSSGGKSLLVICSSP